MNAGSVESSSIARYHVQSSCAGEWEPYRANPVVVDAHRARNGEFIADLVSWNRNTHHSNRSEQQVCACPGGRGRARTGSQAVWGNLPFNDANFGYTGLDHLRRVFQVQGFRNYGASAGVSRIEQLTPHRFKEQVVCSIKPEFFPGLSGTHTFTFRKGVLVFDFSRREWVRSRPAARREQGLEP